MIRHETRADLHNRFVLHSQGRDGDHRQSKAQETLIDDRKNVYRAHQSRFPCCIYISILHFNVFIPREP